MKNLVVYIATRVGVFLVVLFVGITIVFVLPRLMPSDPIDSYLARMTAQTGKSLSTEEVAAIRETLSDLYGLKGSVFSQYLGYLKRVFITLDFGPSFSAYPIPVINFIKRALPYTLGLLGTSTIIAWIVGNLIGLVAGFFHNKRLSTVLEVIGIIIYPVPYYIAALVFIMLFAYVWPIFPLLTTIRSGPLSMVKIGNILYNSILPGLTLVVVGFGWNVLGMKALSYDIRKEGYVIYARFKGVSDRKVMTNYVFRNAILPQITSLALSMGMIFSGAILTEMLFTYPGLGMLMRNAVASNDYNMLYGTITVSIVAVATATLVIDLLYPLFDPRIRFR